MKAKRNIFALLGWVIWKIAAAFGSRYAKAKVDEHRESTLRRSPLSALRRRRG